MDRLSGLDASFLYFETPAHLMHVCGLLDARHRPRCRRRTTSPPRARRCATGWRRPRSSAASCTTRCSTSTTRSGSTTTDFDIEHHVRRVAVPSPGGERELAEVCADIAGQPLDRRRPLWEMWLIEGLADGSLAVHDQDASRDGRRRQRREPGVDAVQPRAGRTAVRRARETGAGTARVRVIATSCVDGLLGIAQRPLRLAQVLPQTLGDRADWVQRARRGQAMPAPFSAPRTSFNGTVTGHRSSRVHAARPGRGQGGQERVRDDGQRRRARAVLGRAAHVPRRPRRAARRVAGRDGAGVRPRQDQGAAARTRCPGMFATLSSDIADPVERLNAIAETDTASPRNTTRRCRRRCCRTGRSSPHRTPSASPCGCTRGCGWPTGIRSSTTW